MPQICWFQDGGYHVPVAHPGLAAGLDMNSYRSELFENISIQMVQASEQSDRLSSGGSQFFTVLSNLHT